MSVLHVGFVASHVSTCMCYATQCFVFNGAWPCTQKRTKLARVSRLFFVLKAWARPELVTLIEVRLLSCILKHHRALNGATLCVIGYHCCTCRLFFCPSGAADFYMFPFTAVCRGRFVLADCPRKVQSARAGYRTLPFRRRTGQVL
jgi:hypothetical protein